MNIPIYEIKEQDILTDMKTLILFNVLYYLKTDGIRSRTYDQCVGKQMFKDADTLLSL
jgi:hypothetical protein